MNSGEARIDAGEPMGGRGLARSVAGALIGMFQRRWRTLAAVSITLAAAGVLLILLMPPKYAAVARVKIDPSRSAALGEMSGGDRPDQNIFDTEVSVMRSRDIALSVVDQLHLTNDPEFTRNLRPLPRGASPTQIRARADAVANRLLANLDTSREKMTYIVALSFKSGNPETAAAVANTFANTYIEYSLGKRTGTATREEESLDQRLKALSQQALDADTKLAQYQAAAGIVGDGAASVTDQQIGSLAGQLADAESSAAAARSKLAVARSQIAAGGIDAVSAVLGSSVIASLRSQRATLVQQQGEIATRYGPRHPETIKIAQQISAVDEQINREANRVIGGLDSEAAAAAARAASLRADMGRLRGEQSTDTRASAQADSYKRQADAAHDAYNRLSQQLQATGQVARSSLSQAQIIEAALPPSQAASPNKKLLFPAVIVLALLAGVATIGTQEVFARGLRTIAEVEQLGLSVLATIPRLDPRQLRAAGADAEKHPASSILHLPMSSYAESYRVARRALLGSTGEAPAIIALVSTLPDEGKTTSTLSLARIMAMSGERVLVIDTDLRRASLRAAAQMAEPAVGLVEVLRDGADPDQAIQPDIVPNLDILAVKDSSFLAEDLVGGPGLRTLLDTLVTRYDRILIDTAPLLGVSDARAVAALADAVIVVVRWGSTPANALRVALSWLSLDQARVAGALFTMVDISSEAYGALHYSRKYAQYYRS